MIALGMMPVLIDGFAASPGAETQKINSASGQMIATLIGDDGFGDNVGAFSSNQSLAEDRARDALAKFQSGPGAEQSNIVFKSVGYGEVAPSACNTSDQGRPINRRVEVWIPRNS